jgi:hypothetical protein
VPRSGYYDVEASVQGTNAGATPGLNYMSYDVGATAAVDADSATYGSYGGGAGGSAQRTRRKLIASGSQIVAKYRVNSNTGNWFNRQLSVMPVRLA